jgi:glycerol-3-phosphate dehydrogenase
VHDLGGTVLVRHLVTSIAKTKNGAIEIGVAGENGTRTIVSDIVVNAAGAWLGRIAAIAGQSVDLELTKGTIIVLSHRAVHCVINRCRIRRVRTLLFPRAIHEVD